MNTVNNVANLIIAKDLAIRSTFGAQATPSNVAAGEVVVTDESGIILDEAAAETANKIKLVQGQGASLPLIVSDIITDAGLIKYKGQNYVPQAEQVEYIGYNPATATGSFDVINNNVYQMQSLLQPTSFMFGDKLNSVFASYKSDASATEAEIVLGLAKNLVLNTEKYTNIPYKVERVTNSSATVTISGGAATHVKMTKGSTTVVYVDVAGAAAAGGTVAAGDVVSFPSTTMDRVTATMVNAVTNTITIGSTIYSVADAGSAANNATAMAAAINAGSQATASTSTADVIITLKYGSRGSSISAFNGTVFIALAVASGRGNAYSVKYKVTSTTGTASFELDMPWQGEDGYAVRGTAAGSSFGIAAAPTAWGLKLTGEPTEFVVGSKNYEKSRWASTIQNMGSTSAPVIQVVANEGVGEYPEVAAMEWFMQGFNGILRRIQVPPVQFIANTVLDETYAYVTLNFKDASGTSIINNPSSFKQIYLASAGGTQFTDATNGIVAVLNAYFAKVDSSTSAPAIAIPTVFN